MKKEEIGFITVDAGIIYVGDPCYQSEDSDFKNWGNFCDKLSSSRDQGEDVTILNHENGPGKGIVIGTAFGDGIYPVYLKKDKHGVVSQLIIDLQGNYKGLSKVLSEKKD